MNRERLTYSALQKFKGVLIFIGLIFIVNMLFVDIYGCNPYYLINDLTIFILLHIFIPVKIIIYNILLMWALAISE